MKKLFLITIFYIFTSSVYSAEFMLNTEPTFTPTFQNRFSLLLGLNPSMTKTNQLKNIHLAYGRNSEANRWWDFNFTMTKGYMNHMTTNNSSATTLSSSDFNADTDSTHLALGVGINYETKYIQTLVPFQGMYEVMGASITYNSFKDANALNSFTGPGLIAKYSVLKKLNDYVSFGGNFIYNLAVVKRSQQSDTENSSSRSLTLSYLTIGIDLSFFL